MSALLHGKPRIGVHALDLGIKTWIDGDRDRSVLTFCRGAIVLEVLADPKCAEPDLEAAAATVPEWLVAGAAGALAVSTRTVRRYIADGQLEPVRHGRKTLRIKANSIQRFVDATPVGNWRSRGWGQRSRRSSSCRLPSTRRVTSSSSVSPTTGASPLHSTVAI